MLTGDADEEIGDDDGESLDGELLEGDMKVNVKHVDCEEDTDFMSAFDRMMAESIMERATTVPRPGQLDISVPVHVKSTAKKTYGESYILCVMYVMASKAQRWNLGPWGGGVILGLGRVSGHVLGVLCSWLVFDVL